MQTFKSVRAPWLKRSVFGPFGRSMKKARCLVNATLTNALEVNEINDLVSYRWNRLPDRDFSLQHVAHDMRSRARSLQAPSPTFPVLVSDSINPPYLQAPLSRCYETWPGSARMGTWLNKLNSLLLVTSALQQAWSVQTWTRGIEKFTSHQNHYLATFSKPM